MCSLNHCEPFAVRSLQIDELGRATSSLDGVGICWSSSEALLQRPTCYTLLVTHFIELCQLATLYPSVTNLHLRIEAPSASSRMRYLYKIASGAMSTDVEQYGIQLAQMAGFPPHLITEARRTQQQLKQFVTHQPDRRGVHQRRSQFSAMVPPTPTSLQQPTSKWEVSMAAHDGETDWLAVHS
jgi:DNA mismatch repair ATPase MutS